MPDHKKIPNVGSFFKNPIISESKLKKLISDFPEIKSYSFDEKKYKVSAAWLIDKLDLKGTQKVSAVFPKNMRWFFITFLTNRTLFYPMPERSKKESKKISILF